MRTSTVQQMLPNPPYLTNSRPCDVPYVPYVNMEGVFSAPSPLPSCDQSFYEYSCRTYVSHLSRRRTSPVSKHRRYYSTCNSNVVEWECKHRSARWVAPRIFTNYAIQHIEDAKCSFAAVIRNSIYPTTRVHLSLRRNRQ